MLLLLFQCFNEPTLMFSLRSEAAMITKCRLFVWFKILGRKNSSSCAALPPEGAGSTSNCQHAASLSPLTTFAHTQSKLKVNCGASWHFRAGGWGGSWTLISVSRGEKLTNSLHADAFFEVADLQIMIEIWYVAFVFKVSVFWSLEREVILVFIYQLVWLKKHVQWD